MNDLLNIQTDLEAEYENDPVVIILLWEKRQGEQLASYLEAQGHSYPKSDPFADRKFYALIYHYLVPDQARMQVARIGFFETLDKLAGALKAMWPDAKVWAAWSDAEIEDRSSFEWPNREQAKSFWIEATRDVGEGLLVALPSGDNSPDLEQAVNDPRWCLVGPLAEYVLSPMLYWRLEQEIERAHKQGDYALLAIFDAPSFRLMKIPFDPTQECSPIFEAIGRPEN